MPNSGVARISVTPGPDQNKNTHHSILNYKSYKISKVIVINTVILIQEILSLLHYL